MKNSYILLFLLVSIAFLSCGDDDTETSTCDKSVIVDSDRFDAATTADLVVDSLSLAGDCLTVFYAASGCDGDSWVIELIDSEGVDDSSPQQRSLRFEFVNPEACLAFFKKEISFDLSELRVSDDVVILNISGGGIDESIRYSY